jgi:hypothetical protein
MMNHAVHFYENDSVLLDGLTEFFSTGLDSGGACLIIATKAHREGLAQRLEQAGFDLFRLTQANRYINLDSHLMLSQLLVEGWPDEQLYQRAVEPVLLRARGPAGQKFPPIFVFGEVAPLLCAEGKYEAAIRLEQLANKFGSMRAMSIRCAYPSQRFAEEMHGDHFRRICAEHRHVIHAESDLARPSKL